MEPAVYGCEDNKIISNIVMFRLKTLTILGSKAELASLLEGKLLINTGISPLQRKVLTH